jgi:hypothetical protein
MDANVGPALRTYESFEDAEALPCTKESKCRCSRVENCASTITRMVVLRLYLL